MVLFPNVNTNNFPFLNILRCNLSAIYHDKKVSIDPESSNNGAISLFFFIFYLRTLQVCKIFLFFPIPEMAEIISLLVPFLYIHCFQIFIRINFIIWWIRLLTNSLIIPSPQVQSILETQSWIRCFGAKQIKQQLWFLNIFIFFNIKRIAQFW